MSIFDQSNLLKASYLSNYFLALLSNIETRSRAEGLDDDDKENIEELLTEFVDYPSLKAEAKSFFEEFFTLVKEAAYILDPELIISRFEEALENFNSLNSNIEEEDLKEYIEDFGLTLENRLLAIKNEHRFYVEQISGFIEASIEVLKEEYGTKIILRIQDTPAPLIGIDDLLNYQIKQLVEINQKIYEKLSEILVKYPDAELVIKTGEEISEETIEDFKTQIEEDKEELRSMQEQNELEAEDIELINDIAAELATNLVYRIYWG